MCEFGSLMTICEIEDLTPSLWLIPYEQYHRMRLTRDIIGSFQSKDVVIFLRESNDKNDSFILSRFGVGWVTTSYLKE
jgi:hypothetical protein